MMNSVLKTLLLQCNNTFNKASFIFKKTDDHSVGLPKGEKVLNEYFWGNQEKNDIEKKM